jgi:hypothetical protein
MNVITPETTVADVVRQCPSTRRIFDNHGLRGCGGANGPAESLSFFASVHEVDLDQLLRELRAEMQNPREYRYREALEDYIYRRFFKAGIFIALTIGVLWGAVNLAQIAMARSFLQVRLMPAIHAHAHAMVFGWVGLFVMGFAYQSFPRFKNTKLWRPGLANLSFYLMLAGIAANATAEMITPMPLPMPLKIAFGVAAALAEITAVALFITILIRTARASIEPANKYEKFIFGSVFWLFAGLLLEHIFFFAKLGAGSTSALLSRVANIDGPLRDVQLLGFATLMIAGVSQRFVPMVYGLARPQRDRQTLIFALMNGSLVLNIACYVVYLNTGGPLFAMGLELAYVLMPLWALLLIRQLGIFTSATQTDRTLKFIRAAYAWLFVACLMMPFFLLYGRVTGHVFAHSYWGAHRHAFTVGFISFMIIGVAGRVVPILAGVDGNKISSLWGPFILINIGCTGRVLLQIATDFFPRYAFPLVGFTGFIELTALGWWGVEMWRTMNLARAQRAQMLGAPPSQPSAPSLVQIAPAS